MKQWWCAAALLLVSCQRCGAPRVAAVDAGALVHRATDLRTAALSAMPEFREARIVAGTATLRRTLAGEAVALEADVQQALAAGGWKPEAKVAGSKVLAADKEPFRLEVEPTAQGAELRVSLPLHDGDIAKFMGAPVSLTTEQLALYLPRPRGLTPVRERFELALEYEARPERAHFLVWQLVDLSTRGPWKLARLPEGFELARKPDGGMGDVPERVALALEDASTQARLTVDRDGGHVRLEYQLDTLEPR